MISNLLGSLASNLKPGQFVEMDEEQMKSLQQQALLRSMQQQAQQAFDSGFARGTPTQYSPDDEPITTDIVKAIEKDIAAQGDNLDAGRLARVAVRALRNLDDDAFKSANVDPKFYKDKFVKIIDQVMKSL